MTSIEWTERTWNPIAGCSVVSPGCTNCYAMRMAHRLAANPSTPHYAGTTEMSRGGPVWTGKIGVAPERALTAPLRRRKPTVYFVNSMSDLFHEAVPDEVIDRVFAVMALCPQHKFQVLTKRAERMRQYFKGAPFVRWLEIARFRWWDREVAQLNATGALPHVWLGVSAEDQRRADERVQHLLATPAAVRFVSAEPLLGPVDLTPWITSCHECAEECGFRSGENDAPRNERCHACGWVGESADEFCPECGCQDFGAVCPSCNGNVVQYHPDTACIDWVIVGGESGPGARPMHPDWARSLRDQCTAAGVAFFFKQVGEWAAVRREGPDDASHVTIWPDGKVGSGSANAYGGVGCQVQRVGKRAAGRLLDGRTWDEVPA